jgi:hypothetical protein
MIAGRHWYFLLSFALSLLAALFCVLVYQSGQFRDFQIGAEYLRGIPNYYFFVAIVLPFVGAGVMYLALENRNVRFWGDLNPNLDEATLARVLRFRKILPLVAMLFSILVIIQDAADKTTALPPYSINLGPDNIEQVARHFACQKQWLTDGCSPLAASDNQRAEYLKVLQENGFKGEKVSGFDSFDHWFEQSSIRYKMESFLSLLAALIVSLLLAEIYLLMMVKNYMESATKSLVIWMVVLSSLWFPTKVISSRQSDLGVNATPTILFFGGALMVVGILLIVFLKMERNDLYKFASIAIGIFSGLISAVTYMKPEITNQVIGILSSAGWIYNAIICLILLFSFYLVTDHFISDYEREASDET